MTTTPALGRLRSVPPRDVWPDEARDFTPWLLRNVDVLSDLLGMDLALDTAEHPVGDFRLDLRGRDEATGGVVIVENQLGRSDHEHLGQLLTYAAGTDPATIVWITTDFRPEHRAALDWLNERTDEGTRFFGVAIEVVQIDDSPQRAPAFKLVAQPNDWEKHVRKATDPASAASELGRLYWDFWELVRTRIQQEHPGWTRAKSSTRDSWFTMATGTSTARYCVAFTRRGLASQLIFEHPDPAINQARFDALIVHRDAFEAAYGLAVEWEDRPGQKKTQVVVYHPSFLSVADTTRWPDYVAWIIDHQVRVRSALGRVGGVPSV